MSEMLGLDEDKIDNLLYIKSFNIRHEPLIDDISTEKIPFYVEVGIKDQTGLLALQHAIVDYLNSTEFIQSRLNFMHQKAEEELAFLERRMAIADSLSKLYIIRNEGINDEKAITRMELLEESLAIYARMQEVKGLQTFNLNIEVLDGFIALEDHAGRGLFTFLVFGFCIGIALRLLLLIFK